MKDRKGEVISTNEALARGAELIRNAKTEMDKIRIAEILGLSREWAPVLENGAAAMNRIAGEAHSAGAIIDREMIAKAKDFDRDWSNAVQSFSTYARAQLSGVLGVLIDIVNKAKELSAGINIKTNAQLLQEISDLRGGKNGGLGAQGQPASGPGLARFYDLMNGIAGIDPGADARAKAIAANEAELARRARASQASGRAIEINERNIAPTGAPTVIPTKGGGGGGGGGSDDAEKAAERLDRYTESLARQTAVLQSNVDTFGKSNAEVRAAQELAKAMPDLNKLDTETRREKIKALMQEVQASEALRQKLTELQEAKRRYEEAGAAAKEAFVSIAQDAAAGRLSVDSITSALSRLRDRLISMAAENLWDAFFPKNGGAGGFGNILSLFGLGGGGGSPTGGLYPSASAAQVKMAGGGRISGPGGSRSDRIPIMASNGEYIVNADAAAKYMPLLEKINSGKSPAHFDVGGLVNRVQSGAQQAMAMARTPVGGPAPVVNRSYHIDARGAQRGVGEEIASALRAYDGQLDRTLPSRMAGAQARYS